MPPRPPEPGRTDESGGEDVAHVDLTPDPSDADWDQERMRAARPRTIRLLPDGTRMPDGEAEQSERPGAE